MESTRGNVPANGHVCVVEVERNLENAGLLRWRAGGTEDVPVVSVTCVLLGRDLVLFGVRGVNVWWVVVIRKLGSVCVAARSECDSTA